MAHRYRLCPEAGQVAVLERHCAEARFVWNLALEQLNLRLSGRRPGSAERFRQLAKARHGTWLGEGSSSVQQQALRDFDRAVPNWRAGSHRRPRWRRRCLGEGFCVRNVPVTILNRRWAQITVPKCGPVRFRLSRPLPAEHGTARITRDRAGRWHVSLTAPQPVMERQRTGRTVGVDLGVAATVATSDGELLLCPWLRDGEARRLRRLERRNARQRKGSRRRERTKAAIARVHARVAGRRKDFAEQTSTRLVREHDLIAIEDLRVSRCCAPPPAPASSPA
jgi:transposase